MYPINEWIDVKFFQKVALLINIKKKNLLLSSETYLAVAQWGRTKFFLSRFILDGSENTALGCFIDWLLYFTHRKAISLPLDYFFLQVLWVPISHINRFSWPLSEFSKSFSFLTYCFSFDILSIRRKQEKKNSEGLSIATSISCRFLLHQMSTYLSE